MRTPSQVAEQTEFLFTRYHKITGNREQMTEAVLSDRAEIADELEQMIREPDVYRIRQKIDRFIRNELRRSE